MAEPDLLFDLKILTYNYFHGTEWTYENLSAPFWRLYWHAYPGTWMTMKGVPVPTTPEVCTVISPYTPVRACGRGLSHHFYLHFLAGYPYNIITSRIFTFKPAPEHLDSIRGLVDNLTPGSASSLSEPLTCVHLCAEALARVPWEKWGAVSGDPRILRIDSFMTENIGRPVSNMELAEVVCMAPNSFNRFFKTMTGFTPQRYFTRKKIERACFMLQYLDASIEEISAMLGFTDRYYFSRVFKKTTGTGPASYRKAVQRAEKRRI